MGFAIVAFTITESGTIEDAVPVEGFCSSKNPNDPEAQLRPCSIFNSASTRAALKLKYKPKIVDGKAVKVEDVQHKFTFIMEDS
jgi:protein TonB